MQIVRNYLLPFIVIIGATLFTFWELPSTFYQQDEWQTLGHNLVQGLQTLLNTNPFLLFFGEQRPFSLLIYSILLGVFKFTIVPTALFAILFQIINALLAFYLVGKITKNKIIAILAALFLITNSVSHQAVTWVSAVGTLPAATFILAAIIMYLEYIKTNKAKYLLTSLVFTMLSLYFKGIGLFLFILLPALFFIYQIKPFNKKGITDVLRINAPLLLFGLIMIAARFIGFFFRSENVVGYVSLGESSSLTIFLRAILYPLTSLFQIFVPPLDLYSITPIITKMQYKFLIGSPLIDLVAQSIVADMVALFGSILILGSVVYAACKYKNKTVKRNIIFAILFFFLSFLPYVALNRDSSYLSSRYFYLGAVPAGILFGYIVYFLVNINKYVKWVTLLMVVLFLFHHASIIKGDIDYQVTLGNERKAVLNGIRELKPTLDNKTIFYVTSDKEYYGPITNPFQNGLGYVLEVWYYDTGKIPKEFLSENFLWDLGAEGYKESGNRGFGYFQDLNKLAETVKDKELSEDVIYAFFFDSKTWKVTDRTADIRARISTLSATIR